MAIAFHETDIWQQVDPQEPLKYVSIVNLFQLFTASLVLLCSSVSVSVLPSFSPLLTRQQEEEEKQQQQQQQVVPPTEAGSDIKRPFVRPSVRSRLEADVSYSQK